MKRRILSLALCLALLCALCCVPAAAEDDVIFPDVPADAPYAEALEILFEMGIFCGDDRGYFNPDNTITRAARRS